MVTPGLVLCPQCGKGSFFLETFPEYILVACERCGYVMRELDVSWFSDYPVWTLDD